ncbi:cytochrome b5-like [Oratosquilla oratoria]|uniref:cytochrome b5-like n=1 Tax=Oratosquilla oratoria TaxID=337810 RepID=UPI003F75C06A
MLKHTYGRIPLYMLQPKAIIDFASQTLGYRESCKSQIEDSPVREGCRDRVKDSDSGLDVYSLQEVASHDSFDNCWVILYDKVYDITRFMMEHPGGEDVLLEYAGRDATTAFRSVGHSMAALNSLKEYLIGILQENERVFTQDGQCLWSTF